MLSVTQRVRCFLQPEGGYVPRQMFRETQYEDNCEVKEIEPAFVAIQGLAVDYLTRFILSNDKQSAFQISILGAKKVDEVYENNNEHNHIMALLEIVTGLDDASIYSACKIVGYDVAYRWKVEAFQDVEKILPSYEVIHNIRVMVKRGVAFLAKIGPVVCDQFTFEGGYTLLVDSGDGDFLTKETLIDFKTSVLKFSSQWSLQLLMYYLLGIHSIHEEFQTIRALCIFNPYVNKSYVCELDEISDEIKYKVSHEVLGYKMCHSDYSKWNKIDGTDPLILKQYYDANMKTDFDVEKYSDGIFEITVNDYWTYLKKTDSQYSGKNRPLFKYTEVVMMIKRNGYLMFLSRSRKGKLTVLNGARRGKEAPFSPQYYYNYLENYANNVISCFHKYWEALFAIADRLKTLTPDKESLRKTHYSKYLSLMKDFGLKPQTFDDWYATTGKNIRLSGRVHGCIVDIDYSSHLYLNPYDGTLVPYSATSMYDKDVYNNTISLISAKRPEMLEALKKSCSSNGGETTAMLVSPHDVTRSLVEQTDVVEAEFIKVYSHDMYSISNRLKPLQSIYDKKLIQVWYDSILQEDNKQSATNHALPPSK